MEVNQEIISLQEARDKSLTYYYTGNPCKRGHVSERITSSRTCKECDKERREKFYAQDRENQIRWREENEDYIKERARRYREDNKEEISAWKKKHYIENKEAILQSCYAYRRKKYKEDPVYRTQQAMRRNLKHTLEAFTEERNRYGRTNEELGYTPEELLKHLQSLFIGDMTLDNMGSVWHIDHHIPVSEFAKSGECKPSEVNALNNLYPMYCEDNLRKSDKPWNVWAEQYPERAFLYESQQRPY